MNVARSEAFQPSLWDLLKDDLPGIESEIASLRDALGEHFESQADIDALEEGGFSALQRYESLDEDAYRLAQQFIQKSAERHRLETSKVVVTASVLREAVRRDIEMLFNVERLEARYFLSDREMQAQGDTADLLEDFPHVRTSVLNYGVPTFSGRKGADFDREALAKSLKEVLEIYEPRLKPGTVKVNVSFAEKVGLRIDLDAVLMMSPVHERLRLSTMIDLESGRALTTNEDP